MSGQGRRAAGRRLGVLLAVVLAGAARVAAADGVTPAERALLADTNLFAVVPEQFHARATVTRADWARPLAAEVWRGGRDRLLVRPLEAKQAGRFLLQRGPDRYLVAPGARQPVKLGAGAALVGGLSIESVLGLDVERDFEITGVETAGRVVTFSLAARPGTAAARATPGARWVVDRDRRLPLRVDVLLADGRTARVVEFTGFAAGRRSVPTRLVLKDTLRGGPPTTVAVDEFEAVAVDEALFSLTDPSARARLAPPAVPGR